MGPGSIHTVHLVDTLKIYDSHLQNEKTRNEIENLVQRCEWTTLEKRLLSRLTFGTAGLRGVMYAGFYAMNDWWSYNRHKVYSNTYCSVIRPLRIRRQASCWDMTDGTTAKG